ncbi:unnamed protein product [Strongylus vulgaris]|uniref:Receptor L-domain domain-containing protein n=1 Tax=Strongylus vulgaris TaxID=40348 RepID=A0A3P7K6A7_STRVU|nr:unnamed protein product [Strongylus vulgaris]
MFFTECDGEVFHVVTIFDRRQLSDNCANSTYRTLIEPKVLPIRGLHAQEFYNIVNASQLHMCIVIELSTLTGLDLSFIKNLTSTCGDPPLIIIQNPSLMHVIFDSGFLQEAPPDTIVIRGNPNLRLDYIESYRNETLTNLDFMSYFNDFVLVKRLCDHGIADNKKLCVSNPMEFKKKFGSPIIDQSSNKDCTTICDGGEVNEHYLALVAGCDTIDGSLIIRGWNGVLKNIENLASVHRIKGALEITNTSNLGTFKYFANLKEVGDNGLGSPGIEITNNEGLVSVDIPMLKHVYSANTTKVLIVKNPQLGMKKMDVDHYYTAANGKAYTIIEFKDKTTFLDELIDYWWLFLLGILSIILLIVAVIFGVVTAKKKTGLALPPPPYILDRKSKFVLEYLIKEITTCNPLIWRCNDRELLWSFLKGDAMRKFTKFC